MWRDELFKRSGDHNRWSMDPNRQVIERFVFRLALATFFVYLLAADYRLVFFTTFMLIAAIVTAAIALVQREAFNGPTLNHWDEMLAFLALSFLFGAFAGPQAEQLLLEMDGMAGGAETAGAAVGGQGEIS